MGLVLSFMKYSLSFVKCLICFNVRHLQFALLRFSFLSDQYSQAISDVFSLLMQNSFSPKTKKKEKKNGAMTSVSFDLPKINSVLCLSSYSPNRIYNTYMTLPKEFGSWCLDYVIEFREFLLKLASVHSTLNL